MESSRHDGIRSRSNTSSELVRHVDHANPLDIGMCVDPFDEALLGLAISDPRDHEIGGTLRSGQHERKAPVWIDLILGRRDASVRTDTRRLLASRLAYKNGHTGRRHSYSRRHSDFVTVLTSSLASSAARRTTWIHKVQVLFEKAAESRFTPPLHMLEPISEGSLPFRR